MGLLPMGWIPKAVAIDIDGTITDTNRALHPHAVSALRMIEDCGIPVIFSTGNVRPVTYGLWRLMQLSGPMVCENGGLIWDPNSGRIEIRASGTQAKEAAEWLAQHIPGLDAKGIGSNAWRESEWCLKPSENYELICDFMEKSKWDNLNIVRTGFAIHLMEPHLSKGEGLKVALEWLGISASDVLAIGDAPNDIPMFNLVGYSVAVGGAYGVTIENATISSELPHCETVIEIANEIKNNCKSV
jgi:hypothetical protein